MIAMLLLRNPTLLRLFLAQALFWSCAMIGITLTSLVGLQLAPLNGLATLPLALLVLGTPARFDRDEDVPLQHGLSGVQKLRATLLADPAVRHVLPRVAFTGLISNGDKSTVMLAAGVDPDGEFTVKGPFLTVTAGKTLAADALTMLTAAEVREYLTIFPTTAD